VGLRARRLRTCPIAQTRQHSQPRGGRLLVRASGSQRVCWRTYDRRAELAVWSCRVRRSAAARAASFSPRPGDRVTPGAVARAAWPLCVESSSATLLTDFLHISSPRSMRLSTPTATAASLVSGGSQRGATTAMRALPDCDRVGDVFFERLAIGCENFLAEHAALNPHRMCSGGERV
jgi:hypothetical protein